MTYGNNKICAKPSSPIPPKTKKIPNKSVKDMKFLAIKKLPLFDEEIIKMKKLEIKSSELPRPDIPLIKNGIALMR
jgi:hypothetical protein